MKITIDGLIYQKNPHGGIARVYREIIPRICDLEPSIRFDLYFDGPILGNPPKHPQINFIRAPQFRQRFLVEVLGENLSIRYGNLAVLF